MRLPRDGNKNAIPLPQASAALARTNSGSNATAVTVTLNAATTLIEISALAQGIYMRYGSTAVTSSNFDEYIQAGSTRHYVKPTGVTALSLIEQASGSTVIVIEK